MKSIKSKLFKIAQIEFLMHENAFTKANKLLESFEKEFERSEDREEIIGDIKSRFAEHLLNINQENGNKVITEEEIEGVIKKMGNGKEVQAELPKETKKVTTKTKFFKLIRILGYVFFWMPHTLWIFYVLAGSMFMFIAIIDGPELLSIVSLLTYIGALILPLIGGLLGIYLNIKRNLKGMLLLLLGIEISLFLLSIFKLFVLQVFSGAVALIYVFILIACATLLLDILQIKKVVQHEKVWTLIKTIGYSIGTLMSGYVLIIWSFFMPAITFAAFSGIIDVITNILSYNPYQDGQFPMTPLYVSPIMLITFSIAVLFYISPIYAFAIYGMKFVMIMKGLLRKVFARKGTYGIQIQKSGIIKFNIFAIFVPLIIVLGIILISFTNSLINSLDNKPAEEIYSATSQDQGFEESKEQYLKLYTNGNRTKEIIKSKYFAKYETLIDNNSKDMFYSFYCNEHESNYVYKYGFGEMPYYVCDNIYNIFKVVVSPVVYDGVVRDDYENAADDYKKVFDENIQRGEAEEIKRYSANTITEGLYSFDRWVADQGANLLDENEKNVKLEHIEIATEIDTNTALHQTTYTLTFKNKENINQEAYIEFSIPEDSVVTDLRLGDKLQNKGIVAPKAAAKGVYEQSLQRSIDPALLEMIGPRTYRLRVFPIPLKNGSPETEWQQAIPSFQKVQFTYVGNVNGEFRLIGLPYTRNLDLKDVQITGKTKITGDSFANLNFVASKIVSIQADKNTSGSSEREILWSVKKSGNNDFLKEKLGLTIKGFGNPVCIPSAEKPENNTQVKKVRLFVDVSKSAEDKRVEFTNFIGDLRGQKEALPLEIYEYNFDTHKVFEYAMNNVEITNWLMNVDFWGYSDKSKIVDTIMTNSEEGKTLTFILTDDSDFEYSETVHYDVNYTRNNNNEVYLIQFGERLTAQKEEINNIIWASGGSSYLITSNAPTQSFEEEFKKAFSDIISPGSCIESNEIRQFDQKWATALGQIKTLKESELSISKIQNAESRIEIARELSVIAKSTNIIDPFNSMIALETDWQKSQLEHDSGEDDAFNEDFDIGEEDLVVPNQIGGMSAPESDSTFILVTILVILISLGLWNKSKLATNRE